MKNYIKYGLIAGAVTVAVGMATYHWKLESAAMSLLTKFITYGIMAYAIFMVLREKRLQQGDYLSFTQGIGRGMRVVFVAAVFIGLLHYLDAEFLNNDTVALNEAMQEEIERKQLSDEDREIAQRYMPYMISPVGQANILFLRTLFMGFILSLVVAAVLRKEDVDNKHNNPMYGEDEK